MNSANHINLEGELIELGALQTALVGSLAAGVAYVIAKFIA
jgi:hypothetical protein